jgi:hypothetical protein
MAGPILLGKRTLIARKETLRGDEGADLTNADFDVAVYNITMSNEIAEFGRKYMTGNHDSFASVAGRQKATIGLSFDVAWSGIADTEPKWTKFLEACGLSMTKDSADPKHVTWQPDKDKDAKSLTIYIQDEAIASVDTFKVLVYKYRGCVGNAKISMDEGGHPLKVVCEFHGSFYAVVDSATPLIPDETNLDTTVPDTVLKSTIMVGDKPQVISKFELDLGNKIEMENDPSDETGYKGGYISAREPKLTVDPQAGLLHEDDFYSRWILGTEAVFIFETDHFNLTAPGAQLIANGDGSQGGAVAWQQSYKLNRVVVPVTIGEVTHKETRSPWTLTHHA